MARRDQDWLKQAASDLDFAGQAASMGHHEWACFVAQQSAEKAVKALHLSFDQEAWGHDIVGLLEELPAEASARAELIEKGRVLDNLYIPTRYPNSHPSGPPFQHYGPLQSEGAISHAREIFEFARAQMAKRGNG